MRTSSPRPSLERTDEAGGRSLKSFHSDLLFTRNPPILQHLHTLKLPRTCSSMLCQLVCVQRSRLCYYLGLWAFCSLSITGRYERVNMIPLG